MFERYINSVVDNALAGYDKDNQFGTLQIGFNFSKDL